MPAPATITLKGAVLVSIVTAAFSAGGIYASVQSRQAAAEAAIATEAKTRKESDNAAAAARAEIIDRLGAHQDILKPLAVQVQRIDDEQKQRGPIVRQQVADNSRKIDVSNARLEAQEKQLARILAMLDRMSDKLDRALEQRRVDKENR